MTDTTSNEVNFLREKLARHLAGYRNRRVRYRNLAFLLKMGTTFFGSATTILLGLKGYSSFSSHAEGLSMAALISSAVVTLAATWETFFDHRWLWVRFTAAFERLTEISDDLEYALTPKNSCPLYLVSTTRHRRTMLKRIERDIWVADGPSVPFFGIQYPTRMTVVRLVDGSLWVCSPIALSPQLANAVNALGPVRHLVSPNKLHHLFLKDWARVWTDAKLYASPGLARRRRDLTFARKLTDTPDPAWASDIDQVIFHGSFAMEEVVFFHRTSRSVIVTDLVQKFDPATLHGWRRTLMRLGGIVGTDGSTPLDWRLSFWNRRAARAALRKALAWNPQRMIIAHGEWVRDNGCRALAHSLHWLGGDPPQTAR